MAVMAHLYVLKISQAKLAASLHFPNPHSIEIYLLHQLGKSLLESRDDDA